MSAQDQMRAMLDQLMGTSRDGSNDANKIRFDDPRVCKSYLRTCCPHEILASTRMDLGDCQRVHDIALRADYEHASKDKDYFYDLDALAHLESFVGDCDHKTEMAKRRLRETQEELSEEANSKAELIHQLGEQIGTKLARAEEVGAEGNVEESLALLNDVETLKAEKSEVEIDYRNSMPASSYQQQKLRVCEVCSAYLGIHDNDRRLADHFGGKLHLGFITIREKLVELQQGVAGRKEQRDAELASRAREREVDREAERQQRDRQRVERDRGDRGRDPDRSGRGHDSERSRGHDSERSRGHRRRSRSRDGGRRRESDRRRRSRSRDRRSRRSRSRSRSRRSNSKSRRSSPRRSHSSSKRSSRRSHSRSKRSSSRSKRSHRSKSCSDPEKSRYSSQENDCANGKDRASSPGKLVESKSAVDDDLQTPTDNDRQPVENGAGDV